LETVPKLQPLTDHEYASFLTDEKVVEGDITWSWDTNHEGTAKFAARLRWGDRFLDVRGSFNQRRGALSIAVLLKKHGQAHRIYALDHGGPGHKNPDQRIVGPLHKHRWSTRHQDQEAYEPNDITNPPSNLAGVWKEFCAEAAIQHAGVLHPLPLRQRVLP
jgi:hypothetical protein